MGEERQRATRPIDHAWLTEFMWEHGLTAPKFCERAHQSGRTLSIDTLRKAMKGGAITVQVHYTIRKVAAAIVEAEDQVRALPNAATKSAVS